MKGVKWIIFSLLILALFLSGFSCTGARKVPEASVSPSLQPTETPDLTKVFCVENYGAKGDGTTNDGKAISKAIAAAVADAAPKKIVQFQAGKTYRVTAVPTQNRNNCLFDLKAAKNVHIQGSNTKILLKAPVRIGMISDTNQCSMSGFIFDYAPKPFVVGKVIQKGADYIDFATSEELAIPTDWKAPSTFFAFRNKENERLHFFSTGYTKLGEKKYRLHIKSDSTGKPNQAAIGEEFILPVPGASHSDGGGSAFTIGTSSGLQMSDIRIYSLPNFGFNIRCNDGDLFFENISFRPEPDSDIHLVCWRDGFHVKDNSGQIIWDKCDMGPLGDDAFNLSSVCMKVVKISETQDTFRLLPMEGTAARPALQVGDEFVAYNNFTGELIGTGTIAEIIDTSPVRFKSDAPLPNADKETYFCFYRYANPNYVVRNSTIEGTVRVRCPGIFENCKFNVFWLKIENETFFEGPVPKDITFKDCSFQSLSGRNKNIVQIGTRYQNNPTEPAQYKCKNIVFQGCTWLGGTGYSAEPGNEVVVK
ncbi:MAG: hypothetical protein J6L76_07985 [Clostridia bacterium]|nr:hypothetical protein [Clostridia bacterium]